MIKLLLSVFIPFFLFGEGDNSVWQYAKSHETFRKVVFHEDEAQFVKLAREGQRPTTLFIGCSDSRVVPELILASDPGTLFVIRTAGNFVPCCADNVCENGVIGTIEYGVNVLKVTDIVVCGHSQCGAIAGLFQDLSGKNLDALKRWLVYGDSTKKLINESLSKTASEKDRNRAAEKVSVIFQLEHLLSFPFIKEKVEKGELRLHGWHFDIERGQIEYFEPEEDVFLPLKVK